MTDQLPSDEALNRAGMPMLVRRELARVLQVDPDQPIADLIHGVRMAVIERSEAREWVARYKPLLEAPRQPNVTDPITVYTHVERTVHALCDVIIKNAPTVDDKDAPGLAAGGIKLLAEAVQALSSWPQFNPMNSHEQYRQLAEYEVEKALKARVGANALALFAKHVQETNAR